MEKEWDLLLKLTPELTEVAEKRYKILANISYYQPVGRRILSEHMNIKERELRNEIKILKEKQLVSVENYGMILTDLGNSVLQDSREFVKNLSGIVEMEKNLQKLLGLQQVIIVPGDANKDETVKQEMGAVAAKTLWKLLSSGDVVSVAGGTTLAELAKMAPQKSKSQDITILPARGGLGERVEIQANTVAAKLADKFNGNYRMLHVPDEVGKDSLDMLLKEPKIKEIVTKIKNADILVHGIGVAEEMAERRGLSRERIERLLNQGVVGEAFGFYLDRYGRLVEKVNTVGISLYDLENIDNVMAVSGGNKKAVAILAMLETGLCDILVTDEGAAEKIQAIMNT
ncbi:sugar-binding transcriptional regulator [Natranaerobius thermophilus]|uniref:Transcriptional regulator, DeoR family n=1 Tax=Natranaerobius thermophilus (strain ATCC BAA-1301 / DSM 18059 / JW/NM-WN-LF) TaxID=457570 RepID=B2A6Z5_NATTJ|nr:sugar-binding domain-containing protein [Natranaerobius thermophilus]ACB85586.1 transcriptional regulator, DeoR family [Natranaerobius thermophilus JW/NM-WN-LF]